MIVHRLNDSGVDQFQAYLGRLRQEPSTPLPAELIDDPRFAQPLRPQLPIEQPLFSNKFDAASYLNRLLADLPSDTLRSDGGLWTWLGAWFFDQICPPDKTGRRKPKDNVKYIARAGDHRYGMDKHLLFFPWKMRALHGDSAYFLLSGALHSDTREQREWTGHYRNLLTPLVELGRRLYWDEKSKKIKRGARSTNKPGNLRRFVQVAKQLEVTYDLNGMSAEEIADLLPNREFGPWLRDSKVEAASSQAAGIKPTHELLAPILEILEKLPAPNQP